VQIVDSHHHLWDLTRNPLPWLETGRPNPLRRDFLLGDFLAEIDGAPVSWSVCVQAGMPIEEAQWLLDLGGPDSVLAGVVAQADLGDPGFGAILAALLEHPGSVPLVGLRDPGLAGRAAGGGVLSASAGLGLLGKTGLPLDLLTPRGTLGAVADLVTRHPEVSFVVDHLGQPPLDLDATALATWASELSAVARHGNVVCKLSGLRPEWAASRRADVERVVGTAFETFGPARLMFGSDWPVTPALVGGYRDVLDLLMDLVPAGDDARDVWGGTARRVYGLTENVAPRRGTSTETGSSLC
jgi:L-fuconolactonase